MHHAKISFATKMFDILDSIEYPVKNSSSNWLAGIVFCIWHIQRNMRSFAIITINLSTARRYDNIWLTNWDDDDKINKFVSLFIGFIINLWNKIFIKQGIYLDGLYWNVMIKVWYPLKASRLLIQRHWSDAGCCWRRWSMLMRMSRFNALILLHRIDYRPPTPPLRSSFPSISSSTSLTCNSQFLALNETTWLNDTNVNPVNFKFRSQR